MGQGWSLPHDRSLAGGFSLPENLVSSSAIAVIAAVAKHHKRPVITMKLWKAMQEVRALPAN